MMPLMSVVMKPLNRAMAGLIAAGVVMDTRDMTFDPAETINRYPTISLTSLAEVVRRDYGRAPSLVERETIATHYEAVGGGR
jgi:hypothetical protein